MTRPLVRRLPGLIFLFVLLPALSAGCTSGGPDPIAQATIQALTESNAMLSTQVAELTSAHATPTPSAPALIPSEAQPADTNVVPINTGDALLPALVADVPLANEGSTIMDLRLDKTTNRLFVTDTANQLHVLDGASWSVIQTLPVGGQLELDTTNGRLYVFMPYPSGEDDGLIHVIDTATLEEIGTLPGRAIAIDEARNRLFVGERFSPNTSDNGPGVRIVDGATLQQTGLIEQPGVPVYNPDRNELLIIAYTLYTADPETAVVTGDLFPDLTDTDKIGFLWCNSCVWVDAARYFPEEKLVYVWADAHCTGGGCGPNRPPYTFDAVTMAEIDPAVAPEVQTDCGTAPSLVGPIEGRRYHSRYYTRYVTFTNFLIHDETGTQITWRDGFRVDFLNPHTGQGYLYDGTVVDLATLLPMGTWPEACLFAYDAESGLLFGRHENRLFVIDETGAAATAPPSTEATTIPEVYISQIIVSPNYASDSTLLVVADSHIYRSTDGGASWSILRGGLPQAEDITLWMVYFSPDYANDATLYATGFRDYYWGDGVWRSLDGGDTWAPLWDNLIHRRGKGMFFSPNFVQDRTLVLQASYNNLQDQSSGDSYQQSTDGGQTWNLVATDPLPPVSEFLPGYTEQKWPAVRAIGDTVEWNLGPDEASWQAAELPLREFETLVDAFFLPGTATPRTIYAVGRRSLWRSTDAGATWEQWDDVRLATMIGDQDMTAAALTPQLADGTDRLVLGTENGQVFTLDPAALNWFPTDVASVEATPVPPPTAAAAPDVTPAIALPTPTPTPTATPTVGPTPAPLTGEPPEGLFRPEGSFAAIWENSARAQQDLGWAKTAGPATIGGAVQEFDGGTMAWREDAGLIYAFFNDGTWQAFADAFEEGMPESDPNFAPPPGRMQPIRGFGKVWRENADAREKLGWALSKESGGSAQVQEFERGAMIRFGGRAYVLVGTGNQGKWY